jgi:hypothetical protein
MMFSSQYVDKNDENKKKKNNNNKNHRELIVSDTPATACGAGGVSITSSVTEGCMSDIGSITTNISSITGGSSYFNSINNAAARDKRDLAMNETCNGKKGLLSTRAPAAKKMIQKKTARSSSSQQTGKGRKRLLSDAGQHNRKKKTKSELAGMIADADQRQMMYGSMAKEDHTAMNQFYDAHYKKEKRAASTFLALEKGADNGMADQAKKSRGTIKFPPEESRNATKKSTVVGQIMPSHAAAGDAHGRDTNAAWQQPHQMQPQPLQQHTTAANPNANNANAKAMFELLPVQIHLQNQILLQQLFGTGTTLQPQHQPHQQCLFGNAQHHHQHQSQPLQQQPQMQMHFQQHQGGGVVQQPSSNHFYSPPTSNLLFGALFPQHEGSFHPAAAHPASHNHFGSQGSSFYASTTHQHERGVSTTSQTDDPRSQSPRGSQTPHLDAQAQEALVSSVLPVLQSYIFPANNQS